MRNIIGNLISRSKINTPYFLTIVSSWLNRGAQAFFQLLIIRLITGSVGVESFSIFVIVITLYNWIQLFDLGIGYYVQYMVSKRHALRRNPDRPIVMFTVISTANSLFLSTLVTVIHRHLAYWLFHNLKISNIHVAEVACLIAGISGAWQPVTQLIYKIWFGEHRGYLVNTLTSTCQGIGVLLLYFQPPSASLTTELLRWLTPQLLLPMIFLVMSLGKRLGRLGFHPSRFQHRQYVKYLRTSIPFWYFILLNSMVYQIDYFVLSQTLNALEISAYNLISKVMVSCYYIQFSIVYSAFPVFTQHYIQRNYSAIRSMILRMQIIGLISIPAAGLGVFVFQKFIFGLLAPTVPMSVAGATMALCVIYFMLRSSSDVYSGFIQCTGLMKVFYWSLPLQSILMIVTLYVGSKYFRITGAFAALAITYLTTSCWIFPVKAYRILRSGV